MAETAISAEDGSADASVNASGVKVSGGRPAGVQMTVPGAGRAVPGAMSADGHSWKPKQQSERGTKCEMAATAGDAEGRTTARQLRLHHRHLGERQRPGRPKFPLSSGF